METMPLHLFKISQSSCQFTIRTMPKLFYDIKSYFVIFVLDTQACFSE